MSTDDFETRIDRLSLGQRARLAALLGSEPEREPIDRLALIVRPRDGMTADSIGLRQHLQTALPAHMVPSEILIEETLPRLPNGKTDHAAVERLAYARLRDRAPASSSPPREEASEFGEVMREIWCDVFKIPEIADDDDFFELGGDSILSIAVASKAAKRGLEFEAIELFDYPTIAGLVSRRQRPTSPELDDDPAETHAAADRTLTPWFLIHTNRRFVDPLIAAFADGRAIETLSIGWDAPRIDPNLSIERMAKEYTAQIQGQSPDGSYYIAGYSNSAQIAYEVAQNLRAAGERVDLLVLLDPMTIPTQFVVDPNTKDIRRRRDTLQMFVNLKESYREAGLGGFIRKLINGSKNRLSAKLTYSFVNLLQTLGRDIPVRLRTRFLSMVFKRATHQHVMSPYEGSTVIFLSKDRQSWTTSKFWGELIRGPLSVVALECSHNDFWYDEAVLAEIAQRLARWIKEREAANGSSEFQWSDEGDPSPPQGQAHASASVS